MTVIFFAIIFLLYVIDESACFGDFFNESGKRRGLEGIAGGDVFDGAFGEVDFEDVAGVDLFDVFPDFKEREAYVDAVSVEDAGKGFCDDDGYAGCFDSDGCVFSGGAAAEVSSADHDVACFDFFGKCRVDVDHAVGCEFFWIECVQVSCGDDDIGIDVVAVAPDFSF